MLEEKHLNQNEPICDTVAVQLKVISCPQFLKSLPGMICVSPDIYNIWLVWRVCFAWEHLFSEANLCFFPCFPSHRKVASRNWSAFLLHACVWLLFLLVNPTGRKKRLITYSQTCVKSAYPPGIYTDSFAGPSLTGSLCYFYSYIHVLIDLLRWICAYALVVLAVWSQY